LEKYPHFDGHQHLVKCRDVLVDFQEQLENGTPASHEKFGVLVPGINVERFPEALQSAVRSREETRKRDGPAAVAKVVELLNELLRDYRDFHEHMKQVPPPRR
jgi:hypothetical protein